MAKKLRLPNGYGTVVTLSGRRRKKYAARVTVGYTPDGKQIRKYIGYYSSYKEALNALSEYNNNPYDIDLSKFTLYEAFEKFKKWKYPEISNSSILGYDAAFKHLEIYHSKPLIEINSHHLQALLDDEKIGHGIKRKIVVIFNQLFSYYENDIPNLRRISNKVILRNDSKKKKITDKIFTRSEIKMLWDNLDNFVDLDIILILLYTGFRISELLEMKTENVFLDENYMVGGNKTASSKDRMVPINSKIKKFIVNRYDPNKKYLIRNKFNDRFKYSNFKRERFERIMESLNMSHNPHDTRHTVATVLQVNGADKIAIRQILGHGGKDITERVYTHADIENLIKNIELIDY